MKENKTIRYDRKKNKIILKVTQEGDIKDGSDVIGITLNTYDQEYTKAGIKRVWNNLQEQRHKLEKDLKKIKDKVNYENIVFDDENELLNFKRKLEELKKFEESNKAKGQLEHMETMIKAIKQDILKLNPIIEKLPK